MNKKLNKKILGASSLALIFALLFASLASAKVWTELQDYSPGDIVTIYGDNSDGAGYIAGETVHVDVIGPNGYQAACEGLADVNGAWSCDVILWQDSLAIGTYYYTATGLASNVSQNGLFTDGSLQFVETGLPAGTSWSVTWGGNTKSSTTNTISFGGSGATADYSVSNVTVGAITYIPSPDSGSATQPGTGNTQVYITFTAQTADNTPPTVDAGGPYSGGEGSDIALNGGSASDDDGTIVSTVWTIESQSVGPGSCTLSNASSLTNATIKCTDNGTAVVKLTATDDDGASISDTANVTVNNANPVVAQPSWVSTPVNCRMPATLTNISFSDAGVIDSPWAVNINWNDGSPTSYNTNTQGAQPDQTHTYNTPGNYYAKVTVTDKDLGSGDNTSAQLTVRQTYTIDFRPPFDNSTPSGLIVNKMKNGRVVPVKVTIFDDCTQSFVTDPASVTIKITKTSVGGGTSDPIEEYADAGQSSAGTNLFRWTSDASVPGGGFWIYNLDSKALGLVVNNVYKVDVYVGSATATIVKWAVLQPVK